MTLWTRAFGIAAVFLSGIAPLHAADDELNALAPCDHSDPAFLEPFEKENGVTVNIKGFEETDAALALLKHSRPSDWDVLIVDGLAVPQLVELGLLAPLDRKGLPLDDIFPGILDSGTHEAGGKLYAVPEKFGYDTIAYNSSKVNGDDMRDIAILWSDAYSGRIAIYNRHIALINLVAIGLGLREDGITADELPIIREHLLKMKERSAMVDDVVSVQTAFAAGDVDIIAGGGEWTTAALMAEDPDMDWVNPDQGGVRWSQSIGIFSEAGNPELARKFVEYVLSPEGQARLATSSCYWAMPSNSKAALTDEEKAILRWDEQETFIANSWPYFIPDSELHAMFVDIWKEMLQH